MLMYIYAVTEPDADVPPVAGLDDAAVGTRAAGGLTVVVSEHREAPAPTKEAVLRHAHVVEMLAATGAPVLPARFGLVCRDEEALQDGVGAQSAELLAALERVRGCAEVGLRVLAPEREKPEAPLGGGDYLRARLKETSERERLAAELHDVLAGHARESAMTKPVGDRLLLSATYLVVREDVAAFQREVGKLEQSHPELALLCSGPWPPYSFAPRAEAVL